MSELIDCGGLSIETCEADCKCQLVHIVFYDAAQEPFAVNHVTPEQARRIGQDLMLFADIADAQALKIQGRIG